MTRRTHGWILALLLVLTTIGAAADDGHHATRDDLVGAWRLVRIDVRGAHGDEIDPFYGAASEGLLIYDRAGWFSVQILSRPRPALGVPVRRPSPPPSDATSIAKEAALDSYYAYYGTWTFDDETSTVTHHATGALYPDEEHATYAQRVQVDGVQMTFTRTQGAPPAQTVQTKIWERVPDNEAPSR